MVATAVTSQKPRSTGRKLGETAPLKLSILTGGRDSHYAMPLISSLASLPTTIEVIGSDEFVNDQMLGLNNVEVFPIQQPNRPGTPGYQKILRLAATYLRLLAYAIRTESRIFHILWLSKVELIDTLVLLPVFRLLGKTLVFTAHNVDAAERDGGISRAGHWMLRRQYRLMDHIFVHTDKMKRHLQQGFEVDGRKITVVPYGLNTAVPESELTREVARERLGIGHKDRVALFFGHITAYKGLEYLIEAVALMKNRSEDVRLVIAGGVKDRSSKAYYQTLIGLIERLDVRPDVMTRTEFIPDEAIEIYFKSADVCVLPYKMIFQSGVLFLAYRFGLPVVATDVGSISDDVIEGRTGFVCRPEDPQDLAEKLTVFFRSSLYSDPEQTCHDIRQLAERGHSWSTVAATTYEVYRAGSGHRTGSSTQPRTESTPTR